jgi:uncharacterized protein (DUF427 family)
MMRPRRIEPGQGQESVWDYPRPPRVEPCARLIRIEFGGEVIAETRRAYRVLETSHPPVYYIHPDDFRPGVLQPQARGSFCEWKGRARYFDVVVGERRAAAAGWSYPSPTPAFACIKDHVAVYAGRMDACYVDDERVTPQPGEFYGGWITSDVVGPFKGEAGTMGW